MLADDCYSLKNLVLIPAYKEDTVIVETVKDALNQNYPSHLFTICVIADQLRDDTLAKLQVTGVDIIQVHFIKSTKAKAINHALLHYDAQSYNSVVVLDADNHMAPDFLKQVAQSLNSGYQAVQGRRAPKNENSNMAVLDGISEEVNNHIYGLGQFAAGLSSRLSGSGMAFDFEIFKNAMQTIEATNGFDKELEIYLVRQGVRIAYNHNAVILDERVISADAFQRQRTRWLAAQYDFLKIQFRLAIKGNMGSRKIDIMQKIITLAQPPRVLLPVVVIIFLVFSILSSAHALVLLFGVLLALNIVTYIIAIPNTYFRLRYATKLFYLPVAIIRTVVATSTLKRADKGFLHTLHGTIEQPD